MIVTTATIVAGVTTGAVATTAHADETNANNNAQASRTTQGQSDLKAAQNQSRQNYADAKTANSQAQTALHEAQMANTNAENAQTAASAKEQQDAAEQKNAQNSVNTAADALKQAQSDAIQSASDPQAVAEAQKNTNIAKAANDQAQKLLTSAQNNEIQAEKQSSQAQNSFEQASKDNSQAQADVKNAQDTVNQAQADVKNAGNHHQALIDAQNTVNQAQGQKDDADKKVNDAQKDVNTKQSIVDTATAALKKAQDTLNNAQGAHKVVNTININDVAAYKKYFKDMYDNNQPTEADKIAIQKMHDENRFQADSVDDSITVDKNNLTKSQQLELTRFAANLLNQVRKQLGVKPVVITTGALKFATDVKNNYLQDKWSEFNHDVAGITRAARENGLDDGGNYYEDASFYSSTPATLGGLKQQIYESIRDMILGFVDNNFDDVADNYEILHTEGLLGARQDDIGQGTTQNFALQVSVVSGFTMIHYFNITTEAEGIFPSYVVDPSNYDETIVPINANSDLSALKQAVQSATTTLSSARTALETAQHNLQSAKKAQNDAATGLNKAQSNLKRIQSSTLDLTSAQAKLTQAQTKLAQAKSNATKAQDALTTAQTAKKAADQAVSQANAKLQDAKTSAQKTANALKAAQAKLNSLLGANETVKKAQDKLNAAQKALDVAKSNHQLSTKQLADANEAVKESQDNLTKAQAKAEAAKTALDNARKSLITDATVYGKSVTIKGSTIHIGDVISNPQIANPMADDPTQSIVMGAYLALASSELDTIPTGTKAVWANVDQLTKDTQNTGNYTEAVLVTFPDGSTITASAPLVVLAKEEPTNPSQPVTPSNSENQGKGNYTASSVTPEYQGQSNTGNGNSNDLYNNTSVTTDHDQSLSNQVRNGVINDNNTNTIDMSTSDIQATSARVNNQLPQTGNSATKSSTMLSMVGVLALAMLSMLGLVDRRKN